MQEHDLCPDHGIREWARATLEKDSSARFSREDVLKGIKEEEERKRRSVAYRDIGTMPTLYGIPAVSREHGTTDKMIAQVLSPPAGDVFVEKVTTGNTDILVLIHQAVEELNSAPMLVVVSKLQYAANEKLLRRYRYYYLGVWIPIISSSEACSFDVRVYGSRI